MAGSESGDKPHGVKYSIVYIKGGKRLAGYDNAEGKGDHRHYEIMRSPINLQVYGI